MNLSIYDGGTEAEPGERAGTLVKIDCGDVLPSFVVFLEFVVDKAE